MNIKSVKVQNFASYKNLEFDFQNQGLCLISGPTGSGKSTLCDIIPWVLFGVTAKNGNVDDIRSWHGGDTKGEATVQTTIEVTIKRVRGRQNDLCFVKDGETIRGKDLNDTQKMINDILGMTPELYLSGAYYHEFSQIAQFFNTTASKRRQLTEQLVDLNLAKQITENANQYKKDITKELSNIAVESTVITSNLKVLKTSKKNAEDNESHWIEDHEVKIQTAATNCKNFDKIKRKAVQDAENDHKLAKINLEQEIEGLTFEDNTASLKNLIGLSESQVEALSKMTCIECGAPKELTEVRSVENRINKLQQEIQENSRKKVALGLVQQRLAKIDDPNSYTMKAIDREKERQNTYVKQLDMLKTQTNPYTDLITSASKEIAALTSQLQTLQTEKLDFDRELADVNLLIDVTANFRKQLSEQMIQQLETKTNNILATYFDAEIKVRFTADDADKLEIEIMKDGNLAVFPQLSKGQRCLLKLAFSVSVMEAIQDHNGILFDCLFFDEALDGLSDAFKLKAVRLFEHLSLTHSSVFLVDHSQEIKTNMLNQFQVTMTDGWSTIE